MSADSDAVLLDRLKEELLSLESDKVSGKITQEKYDEERATLEARLKMASGIAVPDSGPPVPTSLEMGQSPETPNKVSFWIAVPILAVLVRTALLVFHRYGFSAESLGYWVGTLLAPFLIAYAIAGARKRRNWSAFSYWFFGLGIFFSGASNTASLSNLSHSEMLRELAGTKPLEANLPENEMEMATVTKAVFADLRAFEKSQDEQESAIEPDAERLYTSQSFSSKASMQRTMDAMKKLTSLDRETEDMVRRMPDSVKARLDKTGLSESDKEKFLKGFNGSFNNSELVSARDEAVSAENDWADSVDGLYSFAIQHSSQILVIKDSIEIPSKLVREEFNDRLSRSDNLRQTFVTASKKANDLRAENFKKTGVSPADAGLDK